jgi:hypothetical protein
MALLNLMTQRATTDTLTTAYASALGIFMPSGVQEIEHLEKIMLETGGFYVDDCRKVDKLKWSNAILAYNSKAGCHQCGLGWLSVFERTMGPTLLERHVFPGPAEYSSTVLALPESHRQSLTAQDLYPTVTTMVPECVIGQLLMGLRASLADNVIGFDPSTYLSTGGSGQLARVMHNFTAWFMLVTGVVQQAKSGPACCELWVEGLQIVAEAYPVTPKKINKDKSALVSMEPYAYYAKVLKSNPNPNQQPVPTTLTLTIFLTPTLTLTLALTLTLTGPWP